MSCLLMRATLITAAAAVVGTIDTPASVVAELQEVTANASANLLTSVRVAVDTGPRLHVHCELVVDEHEEEDSNGLTVKATLLNVIPRATASMLNVTPSVGATLLNDAVLTASPATEPLDVSISEVCMVSEDDITVLATADGEALRTGNGGYLRLVDDEEEIPND